MNHASPELQSVLMVSRGDARVFVIGTEEAGLKHTLSKFTAPLGFYDHRTAFNDQRG
jgi:hypothetical protein